MWWVMLTRCVHGDERDDDNKIPVNLFRITWMMKGKFVNANILNTRLLTGTEVEQNPNFIDVRESIAEIMAMMPVGSTYPEIPRTKA